MNEEEQEVERRILSFRCEGCNTTTQSVAVIYVEGLEAYFVWYCTGCYKTCAARTSMEEMFEIRTIDVSDEEEEEVHGKATPLRPPLQLFTPADQKWLEEMGKAMEGSNEKAEDEPPPPDPKV